MALPWVRSSGGTGEVQRPASLRFQPEAAIIRLGGAGLRYDASDMSNAAQEWRRQPIVQRALQIVSDLPFRYPNRKIRYNLSDATGTISMRNLAWAYELAHGEVGIGPRVLDSGGGEQVLQRYYYYIDGCEGPSTACEWCSASVRETQLSIYLSIRCSTRASRCSACSRARASPTRTRSRRSSSVSSYAHTYVPGPPYCTYGLRVPASCVL